MDLDNYKKSNGFNLKWENNQANTPEQINNFLEMREWQIRAFATLKDAPFIILNAPMGSGKSWLMCLLSAYRIKNDNSLRCIIVVPQTIIASGFIEAKLTMPDGEKIHWQVKHNLCENDRNKNTVSYVIKWLKHPSSHFLDQSLICTHATLVAVYKKLKTENLLYLFKNILLWIDEAHHIKNTIAEGLDVIINNGIGELVAYLLNNTFHNIQIGLTTASFFRGDRASLLTESMAEKFTRFDLPYDEYLMSMKHLSSFSFVFALCGYDYTKGIELLLQERGGKDIVYIPHPVSQHSTGNKYQEANNITQLYGTIIGTTEHGITIAQKNQREIKILDLVNESQRKQKKAYLDKPIVKQSKNALDAIITLGMFKEGANWIWADRSIIVGARSSLVDVIQMIGRLFRDAPGKSHVEVIQLLPFSLDQKDEANFRENLNNYLKAIFASLILENIFNPVKIKAIQKKDKDLDPQKEDSIKTNWLSQMLPDDSHQVSLLENVSNQLVEIVSDKTELYSDMDTLYEEYKKIIPTILQDHGISEHTEEVAKQIWGICTRRSMQMQGISVENIDFNLIHEVHPLGFLLRYTSGSCDVNTFEKLREVIQSRIVWRSFEEAREFVQNLEIKNDAEWRQYVAGNMPNLEKMPKDIPKAPWAVYKYDGWINLSDFIGTNNIAPRLHKYRSYEDAEKFAKNLKLAKKEDWFTKANKLSLPKDIPVSPDKTYRRKDYGEKWNGWGIFLGTGKTRLFQSYKEAKKFVQSLGLQTNKDWRKYIKGELHNLPSLPSNIPKKPDQVYKEWISWPSFLGSKLSKFNCKRGFLSFNASREFIHKLKLKKQIDWHDYCTGKFIHLPPKPLEIPSNPSKKYKTTGWINWKDWLGTNIKEE